MSWIIHDEADKAAVKEINEQSDRGAILIAASLLEARLTQSIYLRLDPDAHDKLLEDTFLPGRVLGDFGAKINLGRLLQIYPEEIFYLLKKIRKLRNDAAHVTTPVSFETQSVKDLCANFLPLMGPAVGAGMQHQMQLVRLMKSLEGLMEHDRSGRSVLDDGTTEFDGIAGVGINDGDPPRTLFMGVVKIILLHLHSMNPVLKALQIVSKLPGKSVI